MRGEQAQHVLGDIKHYALNDQESGRNAVNVNIDEALGARERFAGLRNWDTRSHPAAVMCSYNRVNGTYACENKYLLTDVLKKDWKYKGFVICDWAATHSAAKASAAGLDQEQPGFFFFGDELKKDVQSGKVPQAELDDHVHRILRSMFATGVIDDPPIKGVVDVRGGFEVARKMEEQGIVLLKNENALLPLDSSKMQSIAVIGPHADVGMISGGDRHKWTRPVGTRLCLRVRDRRVGWSQSGFRHPR